MSLKKCTVKGCDRKDIVALQRQIQVIPLPPSNDRSRPSHTETIMFHYFCKVHFDRRELLKKNVRLLPASALISDGQNSAVGASQLKELSLNNVDRKRKASDSDSHVHQGKQIKNGKSCTLTEGLKSRNRSIVNIQKLNSVNYEHGQSEAGTTTSAEDNDCIITEDPAPTVIDLSDDDADESDKMIELIWCDETEPECTETAEEYVEILNECEDQDDVEPFEMNFVSFNDPPTESIDVTDMENDYMVECEEEETKQSSDSTTVAERYCENGDGKPIDLTDEQTVDEEETNVDIEGFRTAVIREIRRRLSKKFPGVVQTISWNDNSQQFEVSISKNAGFKVDDVFQYFLRDVVNQAIQCNDRASRAKAARCIKKKGSGQVNKTVILNKNYAGKHQQEALKRSETKIQTYTSTANIPTTNGTHVSTGTQGSRETQGSSGTQESHKYVRHQEFKKPETYLGLRTKTFLHIENLLQDRIQNRSILTLLLRKIKLNEPFSIHSDVLCVETKDCADIFHEFLPLLSHTLKGFLQWPTNRREPLAIMEILEIEIEKPDSLVQQNITFCSHRQRYLNKFIICMTSTGYITYVSPAFQAVRADTLKSCLLRIPHGTAVVSNPNVFESVTKSSRISSLYDCNRQTERKIVQRVFDYLRRFSLIGGISNLKNALLLHQALTIVASLYNLELEQ